MKQLASSYAASFYGRGVLDPYDSAPKTTELTGDRIVARIQEQLDSFGMTRHDHQREFHDMFIHSTLPKIYEKTWAQNYNTILRKYGIKKHYSESLIVCPRRYGKTYSVAMYCAAYLMNTPNCEIALFSTGKRTAGKLMALIVSFCDLIPGFRDRVEIKNQELLQVGFGRSDKRRLNCYPGTVAVHFFLLYIVFSVYFPFCVFFLCNYTFIIRYTKHDTIYYCITKRDTPHGRRKTVEPKQTGHRPKGCAEMRRFYFTSFFILCVMRCLNVYHRLGKVYEKINSFSFITFRQCRV